MTNRARPSTWKTPPRHLLSSGAPMKSAALALILALAASAALAQSPPKFGT